jgi:Skp family chaperone for outer membrane proteins
LAPASRDAAPAPLGRKVDPFLLNQGLAMTVVGTAASALRLARATLARRGLSVALSLTAAAVVVVPRPAVAQAAAPTRIAVVNTQRVFNDMQETKALNIRMGEETKQLEAESRVKLANLQKLQKERDEGFKPGSPQYDAANETLMVETAKFKVWAESEKAKTEWAYKRQVKQLFDKVQTATAEVAQKEGFDLVLADTGGEKLPEDMSQIDLRNLKALLLQKSVLFAGPKSDMTSMVILVLDAKYKAAGGK